MHKYYFSGHFLHAAGNSQNDTWIPNTPLWVTYNLLMFALTLFSLVGGVLIIALMTARYNSKSYSVYWRMMAVTDFFYLFLFSLSTLDEYIEYASDAKKYIIKKRIINCTVFTNFNDVLLTSSLWCLVALALDRYFSVVKPEKRQDWCSVRRALVVCGAIPLLGILLEFISIMTNIVNIVKSFHDSSGDCQVEDSDAFKGFQGFTDVFVNGLLPIGIVAFASVKILYALRCAADNTESSAVINSSNSETERRMSYCVSVIGLAYVAFAIPNLILSMVQTRYDETNNHVQRIVDFIFLLNFGCKIIFIVFCKDGFKGEVCEVVFSGKLLLVRSSNGAKYDMDAI